MVLTRTTDDDDDLRSDLAARCDGNDETEVGFPPLVSFFESFLEISLRSAKSRYGNRFRYTLFIDVVELLGFQNGSRVCLQCQGNL